MRRRDRFHIYKSWRHLLATVSLVFLPFVTISLFFGLSSSTFDVFLSGTLVSLFRTIAAYLIALLLGGSLAMIFSMGRQSEVALPVFDVLQSFPTFAVLPMAIAIWGASEFTVIFFLVLTIIWPIFFSTVSALKLTRRDWIEAAEVFGVNGRLYFKKFLLPISLPGLITGSIIGLGEGWEALIATEIIVGIQTGLGPFFELFKQDRVITIFGISGFLLLVFCINKLIWLPLLEWSHLKMEE